MNMDMQSMMNQMMQMMMMQMMQNMQVNGINPIAPVQPQAPAPTANIIDNGEVQNLRNQISQLEAQVKELQSSLEIAKHTA